MARLSTQLVETVYHCTVKCQINSRKITWYSNRHKHSKSIYNMLLWNMVKYLTWFSWVIPYGGFYLRVINFTNFADVYHFAKINFFNFITFCEPRPLIGHMGTLTLYANLRAWDGYTTLQLFHTEGNLVAKSKWLSFGNCSFDIHIHSCSTQRSVWHEVGGGLHMIWSDTCMVV